MRMVRHCRSREPGNVGFHGGEVAPVQRTGADVSHAAVVVSVALATGKVMKLGDVGAEVPWRAVDITSRQSGFARAHDSLSNAPGRRTVCLGASYLFETADAVDDIVIPRGFTELAVIDNIDADFNLLSHHCADTACQRRVMRCLIIGFAAALCRKTATNQLRQRQAACVGGENAVGAALQCKYLLDALAGAALSFRSMPQLARRQSGALRQGGELEPGHTGMGVVEPQGGGGKAAVGSGDDVLTADEFGEAHDPFGDQFRVLHQIGRMADHARYEDFPGGQLDVLEDMVFVLVARVRRFEGIGAGVDLQHDVDDILEIHFVDARTDIDAVAGMEADFLGRDAAERVIDHFDPLGRPVPAIGDAELRMHHVIGDQARIVDLENKSGVDDCFVLFAQRIGDGLLVFLVGAIILVGKSCRDVGRRDRGHEDIFVGQALGCRFEIGDVRLDGLVASVADRPGASINAVASPSASPAKRFGDALGPCIVLREGEILPAGCAWSHCPRSGRLALEAVEAFDNVAEEARFALLAIGDDIDARFDLFPNNLRNRLAHNPCQFVSVVGLCFLSQTKKRCQGIGPGQAAHVGRENSFRALLHGIFLSVEYRWNSA